MANQQPPKGRPTAVATPIGWAHDKTGEQLVSVRGLTPAEGTEDYRPNSPVWMKAYQDGGGTTPEPEDVVGVYTAATMNLPHGEPEEVAVSVGYLRDELVEGIGPYGTRVSGSTDVLMVGETKVYESDGTTLKYRLFQLSVSGNGTEGYTTFDIAPVGGTAVNGTDIAWNAGQNAWTAIMDTRADDGGVPALTVGSNVAVTLHKAQA